MDNTKSIPITNNTDDTCCDHASLTMEFAYGSPTGNFICMECGRLLSTFATRQTAPVHHTMSPKTMSPLRLPVFIV